MKNKTSSVNLFNRRGFLKASSLATLTSALGAEIVFADRLPRHYLPLAFDPMADKNKNLVVLNNKPWNV